MTESIFDYPAINRRLNRKPDPAYYSPSEANDAIRSSMSKMAALRAEVEQMERKLDIQTVNEAKFQRYKAES